MRLEDEGIPMSSSSSSSQPLAMIRGMVGLSVEEEPVEMLLSSIFKL